MAGIDGNHRAHARPQRPVALAMVDGDAHRDALDHLGPQLPLAFSAGSAEKALSLPALIDWTWPVHLQPG